MLLISMTVEQVEQLKPTFAQLTAEGWVIPEWLQVLEQRARAIYVANLTDPALAVEKLPHWSEGTCPGDVFGSS